jgi:hypothetical protein
VDSWCLRCGGEVVMQSGSSFEWGEVPELGVFPEPGAVVFNFDEAEDVGPGRFAAVPDGGADLRFEQAEEALGCGVIVAYASSAHALSQVQLRCKRREFAAGVFGGFN